MGITLLQLALREHEVEVSKGKIDIKWRGCWWDTTLALGAVEEGAPLKEAVDTVVGATGASRGWVRDRARAGRTFAGFDVKAVPPRMAIEVARTGKPITKAIVASMIKAEKDGVGLREFTANLTGKAWSDTPQGASVRTVGDMVAAHPEQAAKALARSEAGRRAMREARDEHVREGFAQRGVDVDAPVEPFDAELDAVAISILGRLDSVAVDIRKLGRRAERDQWPRLSSRIEDGVSRVLKAIQEADESAESVAR